MNFCSLATGTPEERRIWAYEAQKLISMCLFILSECDTHSGGEDTVVLSSMAMRLIVVLTDTKGWKSITVDNFRDADRVVKNLVRFMGSRKGGLYPCIRKYFSKLDASCSSLKNSVVQPDERFLITASAITLALRPFQTANLDFTEPGPLNVQYAAEQYFVHILTIPWLAQRLPAVLLPAMKHMSILSPCLQALLVRLI